ncbi:MAG: hypothetical protein WC510_04020 [Candidatus Omnitrophota bacterium]
MQKMIFNFLRVILLAGYFIAVFQFDGNTVYADDRRPLFGESKYIIGIFKEEGFPACGIPDSFTPEWLSQLLTPCASIKFLTISDLNNKEYFNPHNFDVLILPYGETFPYEAAGAIKDYLFNGGGLFNVAGKPFWKPVVKISGRWEVIDTINSYKEFLAPLGIKYYETPDLATVGLTVTTSMGVSPLIPSKGNVFPYRIPARDFFYLRNISDKKNNPSICLVKSWLNPYINNIKDIPNKWCLIGASGRLHPLDPQSDIAQKTIRRVIDYLSYGLVLYDVNTEFAAYYQREKVRFSVKVINSGKNRETGKLTFELLDKNDRLVYAKNKFVALIPNQKITVSGIWDPGIFKSDFYTLRVKLNKGGNLYDEESNGFVIINPLAMKQGPLLQRKGNEFLINNQIAYIFGVNYYESKLGELMWLRPNILKVRKDFQAMRKGGINYVRMHYHHSKWFRDYFSQVVKDTYPEYLQIADTAPLPSERSLRILDAVIRIAQEQGLIFCMDIFSLVPVEMGDPIGWLGCSERIIDDKKMSVQKEFIRVLAKRYRGVPGITWDLWNEPRLDARYSEKLRKWIMGIKNELVRNGDRNLITLGDNVSLSFLDILDYASLHTAEPCEFKLLASAPKPVIFQEVWNDVGASLEDGQRQTKKLNNDFNAFLQSGARGFVPWQWTRQARLWHNSSEAERWDDDLGMCTYENGVLKPSGEAYFSLIAEVKR